MYKYQLVISLAFVVAFIGYVHSHPLADGEKLEKEKNCKDLCGHCGCVGFYCGDECICECNIEENEGNSI